MEKIKDYLTLVLTAIVFVMMTKTATAQESIKLTDIYENYGDYTLRQFVVDFEGVSSDEIKSSVDLWAANIMNNAEHVKVAEGTSFVTYTPLLTGYYDAGFGVKSEHKITVKTTFEFKDGKMRVTLTEQPSTYVGQSGVIKQSTDFAFYNLKYEAKEEILNKGLYKPTYRRAVVAYGLIESYVNNIKSIEVSDTSNDW